MDLTTRNNTLIHIAINNIVQVYLTIGIFYPHQALHWVRSKLKTKIGSNLNKDQILITNVFHYNINV